MPALAGGLAAAVLCIAAAPHVRAQSTAIGAETLGTITPSQPTAAHAVVDLDGDGRSEILLIERGGAVHIWQADPGSKALAERGSEPLVLPEPDFSVVACADVLGDRRLELVVLGRRGVDAYELGKGGTFGGTPVPLTRAGHLSVRVGRPLFADFVRDVNNDGNPDLIVPTEAACQLWLCRGRGGGSADDASGGAADDASGDGFVLAQTIPVAVDQSQRSRSDYLSSALRNKIEIPDLDIADLNGDGRPDLRVDAGRVRRFFLQGADGRFAQSPIEVDLSIFRDTTPKASVELGETLVLGDDQRMQSGDLNGDGIPDYVIAHRRKVWSFLATRDGPQFTKASTRMVAEDVSAMQLVHLDDDDRKDLLILKVDLPSTAELVLGLVSSIDIDVIALGYPSEPNGEFASKAEWRRTLTLRVPSLLSLLSDAEDLVQRFTEVLSKFRWSVLGDYDGDGTRDLALVSEDGKDLELWLRPAAKLRPEHETERWLREILFENPDAVFDIDRLLKLAAQVFDSRTVSMTGDRAADGRFELGDRPGRYIADLLATDLLGDGSAEVVVVFDTEANPGMLTFEVVRWRKD